MPHTSVPPRPPLSGRWPAGRCMKEGEFRVRTVLRMKLHPDGTLEGSPEELRDYLQPKLLPPLKPKPRKPIVRTLPTQLHLDIFKFIEEFGPSRAREIAEYFEIEPQTASNRISVLKARGLVIGTPGHSTWEITEEVASGRLVAQV